MLDIQIINAFGELQGRVIILKQAKYVGMKPRALGKPVLRSFGEVKGQNIKESGLSEQSPETAAQGKRGQECRPR